jgi:hypothetical protein
MKEVEMSDDADEVDVNDDTTVDLAPVEPSSGAVARLWAPESPYPVFAGLVLVLGGLGLIGYTWGRVAGLLDVPLQLPYLLSGGLIGLGLVLVGITIVNITVRRQDGIRRDECVEQLSAILAALARSLDQAEP